MSIEAMKLALAALETCRIRSVSEWSVEDITPKNVTAAIAALRTAIQQEEAQKPATGKPVWCVATGERVNGEETFTHHDAYVPLADCFPLYTHQAPSVPDDMVRDAERYRFIRDADVSDDLIPDIALYAMESLDEYIDAAMLAAKEGGAA